MNTSSYGSITKAQLKAAIAAHPLHADMATFLYTPVNLIIEPDPIDINDLAPGQFLCIAGWTLALANTPTRTVGTLHYFDLPPNYGEVTYAAFLLGISEHTATMLCFSSYWPTAISVPYETAVTKGNLSAMATAILAAIDHFLPDPPNP